MELKSETGVENRTEEVGHRVDTSAFNVLSLCSGVGGLELGVKLAVPTARTVCFVEREAYCCEVLAERMEDGCLDEAPI
jgi:DNA (cytosine-5)-methyltransferase 1